MKEHKIVLLVVIPVFIIAAGAAGYHQRKANIDNARQQEALYAKIYPSTDRVLELLSDAGQIELRRGLVDEFIRSNCVVLDQCLNSLKDECESARAELGEMLQALVPENELEQFIEQQMEDRKGKEVLFVDYDGTRTPILVDPGKWPDYFRQGKFGYGMKNLFKERVQELWNSWKPRSEQLVGLTTQD